MKRLTTFAFLTYLVAILISCNDEKPQGDQSNAETAINGTAEILCDDQILELMGPSKALFDSVHPKAHITLKPIDALNAADQLMRHDARAIIIARDWLPEESGEWGVESDEQKMENGKQKTDNEALAPRTLIARDALVFYASKSFPYDTMHADHIIRYMKTGVFEKASYPLLKSSPLFVVPGAESSVYGNVINVVCKGTNPAKKILTSMSTRDSVKQRVQASNTLLGIGYLSQLNKDSSVKMIRLSYTDSSGVYEVPKPVHAGYLVQGKYPFPVPIYIALRDAVNNYSLPSGFMLYVARDGKPQRTFFDAGIEPGYAKLVLNVSE